MTLISTAGLRPEKHCLVHCGERCDCSLREGMPRAMPQFDLAAVINELLDEHPDKVEQAQKNPNLQGWFFGQAMRTTKGYRDAAEVKAVLDVEMAKRFKNKEDEGEDAS